MSSSPPDDPVRSRLRLSGGKDRVVLVAADPATHTYTVRLADRADRADAG